MFAQNREYRGNLTAKIRQERIYPGVRDWGLWSLLRFGGGRRGHCGGPLRTA